MSHQHITPKVYYSNPDQGIIVMDFINNELPKGRSPSILKNIPNGLEKIIKLMKTLHATPYEKTKLTNRVAHDYITYSLANIPRDFLQTAYVKIIQAFVNKQWPLDQVGITHNDFRSDNILFNQQFNLIDWELAGLSHPLYDLAYFSNYQSMSRDEGSDILELYLDRLPKAKELKVFQALRGFAYVFSAVLCLPGLASDGFKPASHYYHSLNNDTIQEIWHKMDAGDLNMNDDIDEFSISMRLLTEAEKYL
jgi:aminoglycoside/choline kinase family phosphotransferase